MKYLLLTIFFFLAHDGVTAQRIRRLLIFTNDSANVMMKTQRRWLEAEKKAVEDRDIWIAVFHDPKTFRRMYEHYGVARTEFYLILIDRDGKEKIRSEELVPAKEIFEIIDGTFVQKDKGGG